MMDSYLLLESCDFISDLANSSFLFFSSFQASPKVLDRSIDLPSDSAFFLKLSFSMSQKIKYGFNGLFGRSGSLSLAEANVPSLEGDKEEPTPDPLLSLRFLVISLPSLTSRSLRSLSSSLGAMHLLSKLSIRIEYSTRKRLRDSLVLDMASAASLFVSSTFCNFCLSALHFRRYSSSVRVPVC
ncbi:hypothetical protein WICPIJ_005757 [Wickerhamomyces pijperi]|uniref:Uncharacterized protein n=1 Tax=Wickerhamomyces pijperi TaxID=599730 RepID=A0A9P8Q3H0_WICPI|nr:hypothetical protein WICPIJ_005757 [Wickerhamomyces pijperi]